jgi:DMSO/TMAO reductase YedYZ molybdopterin-dependent catalytic subunit
MRMIVPHLYAWKSAKFLARIIFQSHDTPGFWEVRGYHNHADPWQEERYG